MESPEYTVCEELNEKIRLCFGDITKLSVDAITNAANESLLGGGGVDGAIHRAAGPELLKECRDLNGCETGEAKLTQGYRLPAKYVIHTVGPIGERPGKLSSCYWQTLEVAKKHSIRSVAFPCISTGIYGYPNARACHVALSTVRKWLEKNKNDMDCVVFCLFLQKDCQLYCDNTPIYFPEINKETLLVCANQSASKPAVEKTKTKSHAEGSSVDPDKPQENKVEPIKGDSGNEQKKLPKDFNYDADLDEIVDLVEEVVEEPNNAANISHENKAKPTREDPGSKKKSCIDEEMDIDAHGSNGIDQDSNKKSNNVVIDDKIDAVISSVNDEEPSEKSCVSAMDLDAHRSNNIDQDSSQKSDNVVIDNIIDAAISNDCDEEPSEKSCVSAIDEKMNADENKLSNNEQMFLEKPDNNKDNQLDTEKRSDD